MKTGLLYLSLSLTTHAAAVQPRTQEALTTRLTDQVYIAELKEGFHFNDKAPNAVKIEGQSIKAKLFSARRLEFVGLPEVFAAGRAYLYVCDDAVTFCEPRIVEIKAGAKGKELGAAVVAKRSGAINGHGFIEDDFNRAVALANKKKQLILVDFSARWCPGCMRLEAEIFPLKEFRSLTKNLVKVKIDMDRFENSVLGERFRIQGIPTLLILNGNQEEIDRIYDYQPLATLEKFFNSIHADSTSIKQLTERADAKGDSAAAYLLGKRLLQAGIFGDSIKYLSTLKPPPPELATAQVGFAQENYEKDESLKLDYLKALSAAIESEPGGSRSLGWRSDLMSLLQDKGEIQKVMETGVALADALLKDPTRREEAIKNDLVGEFTGLEPMMIVLAKVSLLERGGVTPERAKQAWAEAAKIGKTLKITATTPGPATRYLGTLVKSEQFVEADRLSSALLKRDPGNGEVQRRRLRVLLAQKRFDEAIKLGKPCLNNSYGRNEFWVAEALAEAYLGARQKTQALELLDRYLSRADLQWPNMQGSKKSLETLRATLL